MHFQQFSVTFHLLTCRRVDKLEMGNKGVQRRRRNALAANSANLHKAQFGKATKFDKLPEAPKSGALAQPVSKSTRKVQQLMVSPRSWALLAASKAAQLID